MNKLLKYLSFSYPQTSTESLLSHISKIVQSPDFLSIPTIYLLIDYFIRYYLRIKPEKITMWKDKKFCLVINKSNLNEDIYKFSELLKTIGQVDNISYYNDLIQNKSCYYSIELLNVFNQYKFILCFENSYQDGYITEKIFNCFFARTIPIYRGASNVNTFFNEESFINANYINKEDDIICFINKIKNISENKDLYLQHHFNINWQNSEYFGIRKELFDLFIESGIKKINLMENELSKFLQF
jgi:hypothetical protein